MAAIGGTSLGDWPLPGSSLGLERPVPEGGLT